MEARGCFRPRQGVTARPVRGKGTGWISHTAAASRRCVFRLKVEAGHSRERPAVPMAPSDAAAAAGTLSTAARCRVGSPCAPRVGLERPAMAPLPHMSSSRLHSGFRQRQQAGALETLRDLGGALPGRGSAWSAAACRRCGRWARVEPGPPSTKLQGRVPPRPLARVEPGPPPNRNHRPGV
jgi:hypothetical protein